MNIYKTLMTAGRVLLQLKHDHRTLGLILIVPTFLITLLKYVFDGESQVFNTLAPMMLGIFPLIIMFLVTLSLIHI